MYSERAKRIFLTLLAIGALLQPQRYTVIQDGEAHGDPPFMLEDGWEPLLNGKDLAGWKTCAFVRCEH